MHLKRRIAIVIIGFVEALLFSGCLFGWPSLIHVLQQEGVYSHLCEVDAPLETKVAPIDSQQYVLQSSSQFRYSATSLEALEYNKSSIDDETSQDILSGGPMAFQPIENETMLLRELNQPVDCKKISAIEMNKIYTVASVAYGATSILIGFCLDYLGLWITRFLGSTMTVGGFICLTYVSKDVPWLLWPALNLIALGTNQLRLSCFQFMNLWPERKTTILIAYSSAYSISTVLFLAVQYAYEASVSYRVIGMFLTCLSLLTFPVTFLMPKFRIEEQKDLKEGPSKPNFEGKSEGKPALKQSCDNSGKENFIITQSDNIEEENEMHRNEAIENEVPLKVSLLTLSSALHINWHFINFFLVLFYSATFYLWAYKTTNDPQKVSWYNQMSGLCAIIAPIFIPIAGFVTDWQIKKASKLEDRVERLAVTMQAPAYTMTVATIFLICTMVCKMFLTEAAIYTSLGLIAISRPFVVGSCVSYLRIRFHPSHFNRLNGIFTTIISLLCLMMHPIIKCMYNSERCFELAHWILTGILIVSLASPLHMMIKPLARKYSTTHLKYRTDI